MKKTIGNLKLTQLSKSELAARELNTLKGGYCICDNGCSCSCSDYQPNTVLSGNYNSYYRTVQGDQVDVGGSNLGYYY